MRWNVLACSLVGAGFWQVHFCVHSTGCEISFPQRVSKINQKMVVFFCASQDANPFKTQTQNFRVVGGSRHQVRKGSSSREVLLAVRLAGRRSAGYLWLEMSFGGLVGRIFIKQFAEQGQAATHSFQCVFFHRAGTECVHTLCRRSPVSI